MSGWCVRCRNFRVLCLLAYWCDPRNRFTNNIRAISAEHTYTATLHIHDDKRDCFNKCSSGDRFTCRLLLRCPARRWFRFSRRAGSDTRATEQSGIYTLSSWTQYGLKIPFIVTNNTMGMASAIALSLLDWPHLCLSRFQDQQVHHRIIIH